jgi:hypothetical protein
MITRPPTSKLISPFSLQKALVIAKKGSEALVLAHEAGVNVAFGTDVGPDVQLAEFDLRAKVLPSRVVLKQATFNGGELSCLLPPRPCYPPSIPQPRGMTYRHGDELTFA